MYNQPLKGTTNKYGYVLSRPYADMAYSPNFKTVSEAVTHVVDNVIYTKRPLTANEIKRNELYPTKSVVDSYIEKAYTELEDTSFYLWATAVQQNGKHEGYHVELTPYDSANNEPLDEDAETLIFWEFLEALESGELEPKEDNAKKPANTQINPEYSGKEVDDKQTAFYAYVSERLIGDYKENGKFKSFLSEIDRVVDKTVYLRRPLTARELFNTNLLPTLDTVEKYCYKKYINNGDDDTIHAFYIWPIPEEVTTNGYSVKLLNYSFITGHTRAAGSKVEPVRFSSFIGEIERDSIMLYDEDIFGFDRNTKKTDEKIKEKGIEAEFDKIDRVYKRREQIKEQINIPEEYRKSNEDDKDLIEEYVYTHLQLLALEGGGSMYKYIRHAEDDRKNPSIIELDGIADYRGINTDDIVFNPDTIITDKRPEYIPLLNLQGLKRKKFAVDAVEIEADAWLVAARVIGMDHTKPNQRAFQKSVYRYRFIILSLDQLVLTLEYYYLLAKAKEKERVKTLNAKEEKSYLDLTDDGKERYIKFYIIYSKLPKKIRNKYSYSEWKGLNWEEQADIYPIYKYKYKTQPIKFGHGNTTVPYSYHKMYEAFVDPSATLNKGRGGKYYANPKVIKAFERYQELVDIKRIDIDVQREDIQGTYAKGFDTSYGMTNAVDDLYEKHGVLIKRQDGSELQPHHIEDIDKTMERLHFSLANLTDHNKKHNLKISHSGKVNMFARKAIGLFVPSLRSIGVSAKGGDMQFQTTFAHEYGHYLDYLMGEATGYRYMTDNYSSTAGKLAFAVRDNMNRVHHMVNYYKSSKECLARAIEQYYGTEFYGKESGKEGNEYTTDAVAHIHTQGYLNEQQFEEVKPFIVKFLKECRETLNADTIPLPEDDSPADEDKSERPHIPKALREILPPYTFKEINKQLESDNATQFYEDTIKPLTAIIEGLPEKKRDGQSKVIDPNEQLYLHFYYGNGTDGHDFYVIGYSADKEYFDLVNVYNATEFYYSRVMTRMLSHQQTKGEKKLHLNYNFNPRTFGQLAKEHGLILPGQQDTETEQEAQTNQMKKTIFLADSPEKVLKAFTMQTDISGYPKYGGYFIVPKDYRPDRVKLELNDNVAMAIQTKRNFKSMAKTAYEMGFRDDQWEVLQISMERDIFEEGKPKKVIHYTYSINSAFTPKTKSYQGKQTTLDLTKIENRNLLSKTNDVFAEIQQAYVAQLEQREKNQVKMPKAPKPQNADTVILKLMYMDASKIRLARTFVEAFYDQDAIAGGFVEAHKHSALVKLTAKPGKTLTEDKDAHIIYATFRATTDMNIEDVTGKVELDDENAIPLDQMIEGLSVEAVREMHGSVLYSSMDQNGRAIFIREPGDTDTMPIEILLLDRNTDAIQNTYNVAEFMSVVLADPMYSFAKRNPPARWDETTDPATDSNEDPSGMDTAATPEESEPITTFLQPKDQKKWSNLLLLDIRNRNGERLETIFEFHNGDKDSIAQANKRARQRADMMYDEFSNIQSPSGATDRYGNPAYIVSPNGMSIERVGTLEADYVRGIFDGIPDLEKFINQRNKEASQAKTKNLLPESYRSFIELFGEKFNTNAKLLPLLKKFDIGYGINTTHSDIMRLRVDDITHPEIQGAFPTQVARAIDYHESYFDSRFRVRSYLQRVKLFTEYTLKKDKAPQRVKDLALFINDIESLINKIASVYPKIPNEEDLTRDHLAKLQRIELRVTDKLQLYMAPPTSESKRLFQPSLMIHGLIDVASLDGKKAGSILREVNKLKSDEDIQQLAEKYNIGDRPFLVFPNDKDGKTELDDNEPTKAKGKSQAKLKLALAKLKLAKLKAMALAMKDK